MTGSHFERDAAEVLDPQERREDFRRWRSVRHLPTVLRSFLFLYGAASAVAALHAARKLGGDAEDVDVAPLDAIVDGAIAVLAAVGFVFVKKAPVAAAIGVAGTATLYAVGVLFATATATDEPLLSLRTIRVLVWPVCLWTLQVTARNYARLVARYPELTAVAPAPRTEDGLAEGGAFARRRTAAQDARRRALAVGGAVAAFGVLFWAYGAWKDAVAKRPPDVGPEAAVGRFVAAWNDGAWDRVGALASPASVAKMTAQVRLFVRREKWDAAPPRLADPEPDPAAKGKSAAVRFAVPGGKLLVRFAFRDGAWVFVGLKIERG